MGCYYTTKPKDYSAIALNTDKEVKNAHVIDKKKYYKVFRFKEEQGTLTMIIAFLLVIAALLIGVFFYVITLQNTAIRRIKSDWYKELVFSK